MKGKKNLQLQFIESDQNQLQKSIYTEKTSNDFRILRQDISIQSEGLITKQGKQIRNIFVINENNLQINDNTLGKGASAIVMQGIYKPLGIPVAIKSINTFDQQKRHQLMNDIKVLLKNIVDEQQNGYKCNFIVNLYGAYYQEGYVKLILELMDAGSLQDVIMLYRKSGIEPDIDQAVLAKVALQILCGLTYLHSTNHIHRDIKPGNILLNSKGQVKLSDFGITRQLLNQNQFSQTKVGTTSYLSPQRIIKKYYSYKSDVWGLGLIMYELATGHFPYHNSHQLLDLKMELQKVGTPQLPSRFSQQFNDFIQKSMALDEQERWSSFELLSHKWILNNFSKKSSIKKWIQEMNEKMVPLLKAKNNMS